MSLQEHIRLLNAARAESEQARAEALRFGEELTRLEGQLKTLERVFDPRGGTDEGRRNELRERVKRARAQHENARDRVKRAREALVGLHDTIAPLVDPRAAIASLPSDLPILLLPLRLETRFATVQQDGVEQPCLLVRVYPDDAWIDTFEETLSETEATNARRFWCGWWKSHGNDAMRRSYWRELVAAHGQGRAHFAATSYRPLPASDAELAPGTADVILVVPCTVPLAGTEKSAFGKYTEGAWRAGGDASRLRAAFEALVAATSASRAEALTSTYAAFNANEPTPADRSRTDPALRVRVQQLVFTDPATLKLRNTAWATQPKMDLLPERFVLILERGEERLEVLGAPVVTPLAVGPDPRAPKEEQYHRLDGGDLHVPEEQRWMTDFDVALATGLAFRAVLTPAQAEQGFDRVYVLGVRVTSDPLATKSAVERWIARQHQSSHGFSLIAQGTPTNRTESDSEEAVWQGDDGYEAFARSQTGIEAFDATETDAWRRRDGARLADALGIDPGALQPIRGAERNDMGEARAMNAALWPATLGYWMDTMMNTVFDDATIGRTREFFERHVAGRGALPAVRIGKQPYGLLPATAFSRIAFPDRTRSGVEAYVAVLYGKLASLREKFWNSRGNDAAHLGKATADPQQLLLDILGLHPSAIEFHQQWAQSVPELWNRLSLDPGFAPSAWNEVVSMFAAPLLLAELGHTGAPPDLLDKIFTAAPILLSGPTIDDRPSSEEEAVRVWTTDGRNYLEWLADTAASSLDVLRKEEGFLEGTPPDALLYLLLKHALELGFYRASLDLQGPLMEPAALQAMRREKSFLHIEAAAGSESRYSLLYATDVRITGDPALTIADHIVQTLDTAPETHDLKQQIAAVEYLEGLPTARLERLFAEHIDVCTHRLDAWLLGVVAHRLEAMRERRPTGIAVGAYGYVENLRPKPRPQRLTLDEATALRFGTSDVSVDPGNGGFIHALSPDHAVTAAVLRSGHMRNAVPSRPDLFAIDLSSERARIALSLIEGLRTGQSLGALLGYRFERGLHDRGDIVELDKFLLSIRMEFPLQANRLADTTTDEGSIDTIEARNVVDGVKLLDHVNSSPATPYPWAKDLLRGTPEEEAAIDAEVQRLDAANDALADLSLAESVHQMARGNTDRAAAAMDMFSKGTFPVQPEVVRTPRGGIALTHRMALHLDPDAAPGLTPRARAEPALNAWLRSVLPSSSELVLRVGRATKTVNGGETITPVAIVSWSQLGLDAIDLLHMLDMHSEQGMNEIDDRVRHLVYQQAGIPPDADLRMIYTQTVSGKFTLFEVAPLVESLRTLVLGVRPWSPTDAMPPNEAQSDGPIGTVDRARLQNAWDAMESLRDDAASLKASLDALPFDPLDLLAIFAAVDGRLDDIVALQKIAGAMGVASSGFGGMIEAKRSWCARIRAKAEEHAARWTEKLALCDTKLAEAAAPGLNDHERVEILKKAEAAISTVFTRTGPLSPGPFAQHIGGLRTAFLAVRAELDAVVNHSVTTMAALWNLWQGAVAHMAPHDPTDLALESDGTPVVTLVQDMSRQLGGMRADLDRRLTSAEAELQRSDAVAGAEQCNHRIAAGKALFGDDFVVLPRYTVASSQRAEWSLALGVRVAQMATARAQGIEHPVDEWLYGVARVRPKASAWETMVVMSEALATSTPQLEPLQFPANPGEPWLAMQWPATFDPGTVVEHLLYTPCHSTGSLDPSVTVHCGLLLDEWTEVVPSKDEVTSVAFHYDRPSTEAPQAWLLATPASVGEQWTWEDLRATIPDTFALARIRAIEPAALDDSVLARFLPATIAAVAARRITIGVDLAQNIKSEAFLATVLPDA
jgi:hypothetical protein